MPARAAVIAFSVFVLLFLTVKAAASVIKVPQQQPTIQDGINAASNGDTVLVSAGTYYENINFNGKAITVTSASGPAGTIIDGSQTQSYLATVTFQSGETSKSVISGFTIQNGNDGDIYIEESNPTVAGNIITNTTHINGVGVNIFVGGGTIQGNLITNMGSGISVTSDTGLEILGNLVTGEAGTGIAISPGEGADVIQQNTVIGNAGSGIYYYQIEGSAEIVQNFVQGNQGTGIVAQLNGYPIAIISNTVANNDPGCCSQQVSELVVDSLGSNTDLQNNLIVATGDFTTFSCTTNAQPTFTNNDIFSAGGSAYGSGCPDQTGTSGNISADPLFVDILSGNYHLQSGSPAIQAGTTSAPDEPGTDWDGDPRVINGSIDIGADEYVKTTAEALSAYALHFDAQDVGTTSAAQTVTFTNNKSSAVAVSLIAAGPNYSQTNNCSTSLAAGASCQINVTFSPLVGGTVNSAVGIFTGATANPLAVQLVGTGLAPQAQLPCCYYFYGQVIYTTGTSSGQLTNTGQAPLAISSIVYSGTSDFVVTNTCPIAPNTLAVGASCTVTVAYTPTIVGSESGTITFNDNAQPSPQTVNVYGSSVSAGVPTLAPTSLTFPTTLIGQSSAAETATLSNAGTGPLGVGSIYSYGDFPETSNCPTSLAVGASCTISVTFTPSYQGSEFGYVFIPTDSASGQINLSVTGTGQAPAPTITSLSQNTAPSGSSGAQITITGTGFVENSTQVLWNGVALPCCSYTYGTTQITTTIPAANLATPGTFEISVFTPTPGGGTSSSLPFVVYQSNNYAFASTKYDYKTITGTNLQLCWYCQPVQITPPFTMQFGGGNFTSLWVAPGGTISFSNFGDEYNSPLPTTQVNTLVAPFWAPLYAFGSGDDNNVFWEVLGSEPNRELVVEWRDVGICCETTNTVTFEVVFYEGSSNIVFNYKDTVFGGYYSSYNDGATATAGVQVSSSQATQFSYDQPSLKSQTALLWYPSAPTASVSTGNLSFGYHVIGSKSHPQKVTLTNGGETALSISSIATDNGDFIAPDDCHTTLAPRKSCSIRIVFDPSAPVTETATLTITDNAANSPQTVALSGTGSVTPILIYPILANFGSVTVGQTGTVPVVLANAANSALSIQQITTSPSVYGQTNNCGTALSAGASCTISVTFTPTQQGNVSGKLSMALDGKALKEEVKLVGSGSTSQ